MYSKNPEDYLTHTGLIIKKISKKPIKNEQKNEDDRKHNIETEEKKLEIEIEEKRWRSCCFDLHKESSLFFGKLTVSLAVISLCGYQLITLKDCNYQSLYSSLLSSVITFWLSKK